MRRGVRKGTGRNEGPRGIAAGEFDRLDGQLLAELDRSFAASASLAGDALVCRPGCSDCCHGPFPISELDACRLREGLLRLKRRDAPRAEAIRSRAEQAVSIMTPGFPGQAARGDLSGSSATLDRFFESHAALPCAALDPVSGRCELYEHRPVSCRTYGPPLRFDQLDSPPCDLCFRGASSVEIERCRYRPDPERLEERLLQILDTDRAAWGRPIAFALVRGGSTPVRGDVLR